MRRRGVPQKGETKLKLVVIDGQGGGFGRAIIEALRAKGYTGEVLAVGTNAAWRKFAYIRRRRRCGLI